MIADAGAFGNLAIAESLCQQFQHVVFTRRQRLMRSVELIVFWDVPVLRGSPVCSARRPQRPAWTRRSAGVLSLQAKPGTPVETQRR